MREIILDTETTGLDPTRGDRLVEIGCLELLNSIPTGKSFHKYLNPERDMPDEAFRIHGLSANFLKDMPVFSNVAAEFMDFIGDARLVIHNAEFDMRFINAELSRSNLPIISMDRVLDTLLLARRKHPGMSNSLDALCARYHIDNSRRTKHGALLDSELLAEVYIELTGGHQKAFALNWQNVSVVQQKPDLQSRRTSTLPKQMSALEVTAHFRFIEEMGDKGIWQLYLQSKALEPPNTN